MQRLLVVEKNSRQLQGVWEDERRENIWVVAAGKRLQDVSIPQKLQKKPVGRAETFLQTVLVNHVECFPMPTFCGSSWKPSKESPSSSRCLVLPRTKTFTSYLTRWKLHWVWVSSGSEMLSWFETDVYSFETKVCQGSWLRRLQTKEVKKKHEEDVKMDEETAEVEQEAPFPLVIHKNKIFFSIFSNAQLHINNQQIYNSKRHKRYASSKIGVAFSEYKGVFHCKGYDYEEFLDETMEARLSEPFFTRRMKMPRRPDGFVLYGKLAVNFFSTFESLHQDMKVRLRIIRAKLFFNMISDNPDVSLENIDRTLYTRRIALKDDYHRKQKDMLAHTPVEFNYLEIFAKSVIIPARQNRFNQENTFNNPPVGRIAIAMNSNSAFTGSHWKSILVSTIWCQTIWKFQRRSANCGVWCCW